MGERLPHVRDTSAGCLSHTPSWAPGLQARPVPWQESNWQPFGSQDSTQFTEPHPPGQNTTFLNPKRSTLNFLKLLFTIILPPILFFRKCKSKILSNRSFLFNLDWFKLRLQACWKVYFSFPFHIWIMRKPNLKEFYLESEICQRKTKSVWALRCYTLLKSNSEIKWRHKD